ncbi:TVP38/TMEM64 family protein [Litoreibacter arenae]|uniref:TVP38/TMEM64 family membrane protein n=1 Tax=Litoreibacter arenae DSM 19593 TaxID=1123360 RepID=S9RHJ7_9RHOB|nr:TVP38/TMEM64 family protein [Litoreibacter arenae]EPX77565.1 hypothetical protein thalar_03290 [Litoreibacter arenae DSM 19593]
MRFRNLGIWTVAVLAIALTAAWATGRLPQVDREMVAALVEEAGPWGPILIIAFMLASIVASPIPSAPVALVSGAAYGHLYGTIYVAIGSVLGAVTAFTIARHMGRGYLERWLGDKTNYGLLGSQNLLMLTVFGSRLLPFISFDAMSYAAGLSRLHLWRFLVATLAGILPASFVLAHFGAEAMTGDFGKAEWIVLGLGLMTAIPLILAAIWRGSETAKS